MKSSQKRSAAVVVVLVLLGIGAFLVLRTPKPQPKADAVITSSDGKFSLTVPPDALPKGMKTEDIHISGPTVKDGTTSYKLAPDGTVFLKPVHIGYTAPSPDGEVPVAYTVSANGDVDPIEGLQVRLDDDVATVSGDLRHFSDVEFGTGFYAHLRTPDKFLYKGETFPVGADVAQTKDWVSYAETPEYIIKSTYPDKEWTLEGKFTANAPVSPALITDAPPKTSVGPSGFKLTKNFTCDDIGFGTVGWQATIAFNLTRDKTSKSIVTGIADLVTPSETKATSEWLAVSRTIECKMTIAESDRILTEQIHKAFADAEASAAKKEADAKAAQTDTATPKSAAMTYQGSSYYIVRSDDPLGNTGDKVCKRAGKTCLGYTAFTTALCLQAHPGAQVHSDFDGSKAGFYCNGAPQGGVCAKEANVCHICPACNVNMDCAMEIGVLYRETYVQCK